MSANNFTFDNKTISLQDSIDRDIASSNALT